jgi:HprK-related kinase A
MSRQTAGAVGDLSARDLERVLRTDGLAFQAGPFDFLLRARVHGLAPVLRELYRDYPRLDPHRVFSARVAIRTRRSLRRPWVELVRFTVDGRPPHEDMPAAHALAVLEWGLNLVTAMRHQRYLMLHAAVVERNGRALLLPAWPGHGKTTLCAALVHRGWRLLSDEFGLVRPGTTALLPVPRLMPLKNESIGVIRSFAPEAVIGPEIVGTRKGTVAHVRPPRDSVLRGREPAEAGWLVFPRWIAGAALQFEPVPKAQAFMELATNAFNYEVLGAAAFETVHRLVGVTTCHRLIYSNLDHAVEALTALADGAVR